MSTGAARVSLSLKRLLGAEDFRERFLEYLVERVTEFGKKAWDNDGVFDSLLTLAGSAPDTFLIDQTVPGGFEATDGQGVFLSLGANGSESALLGQIKSVVFENTAATLYYVSLQACTRPSGIQINPRNGLPLYDSEVDAIGVRAEPDSVQDNGSTLTFVIDSVCEAGHSHAGRTAIVFLKTPVRGGTTELVAIETLTVAWNGVNNRITTTGLLGQSTPSVLSPDYEVVLLGPTVRKVDTSALAGHVYLGTVTGAGAGITPVTTSTSGQALIDHSLFDLISYGGGGAWADGTTNPATSIEAQLDKIIADLTSVVAGRGAAKLTCAARANWVDGTTNPATDLSTAVLKIVSDLASTAGLAGGANLIGINNMPFDWANGDLFGSGVGPDSVAGYIALIVLDIASAAGSDRVGNQMGAGTWDGSHVEEFAPLHDVSDAPTVGQTFEAIASRMSNYQPHMVSIELDKFLGMKATGGTVPTGGAFATGQAFGAPNNSWIHVQVSANGSNSIRASLDGGRNWDVQVTGDSDDQYDVAFGRFSSGPSNGVGYWVSCGQNGKLLWSSQGYGSWTPLTISGWPASTNVTRVMFSKTLDKFFAYGMDATGQLNIADSVDGENWVYHAGLTGLPALPVDWAEELDGHICVHITGVVLHSTDGLTFTDTTPATTHSADFFGVSHDLFWLGENDSGDLYTIWTSPDGITWTDTLIDIAFWPVAKSWQYGVGKTMWSAGGTTTWRYTADAPAGDFVYSANLSNLGVLDSETNYNVEFGVASVWKRIERSGFGWMHIDNFGAVFISPMSVFPYDRSVEGGP